MAREVPSDSFDLKLETSHKVTELLNEFSTVMPSEITPIRNIQHAINLIP